MFLHVFTSFSLVWIVFSVLPSSVFLSAWMDMLLVSAPCMRATPVTGKPASLTCQDSRLYLMSVIKCLCDTQHVHRPHLWLHMCFIASDLVAAPD